MLYLIRCFAQPSLLLLTLRKPLTITRRCGVSGTELATVLAEARDYVRQAKSVNTIRAYRADWRHFEAWCVDQGREALPASAETIALYMTELARTHRVSTLTRRLTALSEAHELA